MRRIARPLALPLLLALSSVACGNLLGLGDFEDAEGTGGSSATSTSASTGTGGTGGTGGAGSTATTGTTSTTGTGGEGGKACVPGTTMACYDGPAGTENVGECKSGTATCEQDGSAYGLCMGQVLPAAEDCATKADQNCAPDCAEHQWSLGIGSANEDFGALVAIDGSGNTYAAGQFAGSLTIGQDTFTALADYDSFVVKLGPTGDVLWARHYGSPQYLSLSDLRVDQQGNLVIGGGYSGAVDFGGQTLNAANGAGFVAKIDAAGTCSWAFSFGASGSDFVTRLAIDPAGNILATGNFYGPITQFGGSYSGLAGQDPFVFKLDTNGTPQWIKTFGGNVSGDFGLGIAADAAGSVLISGLIRGTVTFAGGPPLTASAGGNGYIAKLDALGSHVWSKLVPGSPSSAASAVAVDAMGRVYATGSFQGTTDLGGGSMTSAGNTDVFLVQYDGAGNHLWSKRFGGSGGDSGSLLVTDGGQHVFVEGSFSGSIDLGLGPVVAAGSNDVFFARLDDSGAVQWNRTFEYGVGLALDGTGAMFLSGSFYGTLDLGGPAPLVEAGSGDVFAAKLARPLPIGVP